MWYIAGYVIDTKWNKSELTNTNSTELETHQYSLNKSS